MKIKAIIKLDVNIEEFVKIEGLNENSTQTDIEQTVENYVDEINKTTVYTVMNTDKYNLIKKIKKVLSSGVSRLTNTERCVIIKIQKTSEVKIMEFVKVLKVELDEEEENAIDIVLRMLERMWEQSENHEMEDLWETYGSEEEDWVGIEDTLRNLLTGGK